MPKMQYKDGTAWRTMKKVQYNDAGTWRTMKKVQYNDNGTWRTVFAAGYGDGSLGDVNVQTGSQSWGNMVSGTHYTWDNTNKILYLNSNTIYNFSSLTIGSGVFVTTSDVNAVVIYILCLGTFSNSGQFALYGRVTAGQNTWSTTIDSVTYTTPSTANGGSGYNSQGSGFGAGGDGGMVHGLFGTKYSGHGAAGGSSIGAVKSAPYITVTTSQYGGSADGLNGNNYSGGGTGAVALNLDAHPHTTVIMYAGNGGGGSYGANGSDYDSVSGSYSNPWQYGMMGGGGAGGSAGQAGIHLVVKCLDFFNDGIINVSGTNGTNGGNGGASAVSNMSSFSMSCSKSSGGSGGGGGNSGNIYVTYKSTVTTGTMYYAGGSAGVAGSMGIVYTDGTITVYDNSFPGNNGTAGSAGTYTATQDTT